MSKVKFRQASSNRCERVLQVAKVAYAYANKTRVHHFQKTWLRYVWGIANSVLNKDKSAIPLLFDGPEVLSFCIF